MRLNKKIAGTLILAILILSIGVGASYAASNNGNNGDNGNKGGNSADNRQDGAANGQEDTPKQLMVGNPHDFKQLKLEYAITNPEVTLIDTVWTHVAGNEVSGFKLCLNETIEYYYLDVMKLKPYSPIVNGTYNFTLDTALIEDIDGWKAYWESRGVNVMDRDANSEYLQVLYDIFIAGEEPVFCLQVAGENYRLLDGFYFVLGEEHTLRVDGDYFLGTFTYKGEVSFENVDPVELTMQITFRACESETCVEE